MKVVGCARKKDLLDFLSGLDDFPLDFVFRLERISFSRYRLHFIINSDDERVISSYVLDFDEDL